MKSDLIGQVLQRYTDVASLRPRLTQKGIEVASLSILGTVKESNKDFEDRVDKYNSKVYKLRTLILNNYDSQIADQYAEVFDTAVSLQTYLE